MDEFFGGICRGRTPSSQGWQEKQDSKGGAGSWLSPLDSVGAGGREQASLGSDRLSHGAQQKPEPRLEVLLPRHQGPWDDKVSPDDGHA